MLGLLERTRTRGGVVHPLLHRLRQRPGQLVSADQAPAAAALALPQALAPLPEVSDRRALRDVFDVFITGSKRATWYTDWAQRTLSPLTWARRHQRGLSPDGRRRWPTVRCCAATATAKGHRVWPGAVRAPGHTADGRRALPRLRPARRPWRPTPRPIWIGRPCLSFQCAGRYAPDDDFGQHYYRAIYERGHVERIFPHEHTGLLDRNVREDVETQFKQQDRADAANLLTATPTLELGIDIGDLSATMACSVPPATANYLQRIGRAGRKTGNSLILALANASAARPLLLRRAAGDDRRRHHAPWLLPQCGRHARTPVPGLLPGRLGRELAPACARCPATSS